jgi:D-glycero-D-manno-heptose 1,7-bisphosphate phosphatase
MSTRESARPAAFLDRDGVINVEVGHLHRIEDFAFVDHAIEGMKRLASSGYTLVVVTNQAGIAKGLYGEPEYRALTDHMLSELGRAGIQVAGVYHCPHHPQGLIARYAQACDCRKPRPGMLLAAARDHHLDLSRSVLIGDKTSDTLAGRAAGLQTTVLVETGHALPPDAREHADHCCANLAEAARWLDRQLTETTTRP